jgi:CHASE1-domain containing sensor protein/two-component sensor histidine kinase
MKKLLPTITFVVIAAIGMAGATFQYLANERADRLRFEAVADEAINRIEARLNRHLVLLDATAAFLEANEGAFTPDQFATFADQLDLGTRHAGIAGLGFAPLAEPLDRPAVTRLYREAYDTPLPIRIRPAGTTLPFAAPVSIIAITDDTPPDVLGYDMYSEPARRQAMEEAAAARAPRSTVVSRLATDTENAQRAFVVYAPLYRGGFGIRERPDRPQVPTGYAFAGFRVGDFLSAAMTIPPFLPVNMTVYEDEAAAGPAIFAYGSEPEEALEGYGVTRTVDIAGQTWALVLRPSVAFRPSSGNALSLVLGAVSLLLAAALAASLRAQDQAHAAARQLAQTMERNLVARDLMLQEMKHRIKNSIARILAMARQTARRSPDLEAFSKSFTARLQAMANAQDMLTRSTWGRADLRALLLQELGQVFGEPVDVATVAGPEVSLDEVMAQALGLTFHELATNALKYGGDVDSAPAIAVSWRLRREAGVDSLWLTWRETGSAALAPPATTGFGTRLIDANIRSELHGEITRSYRPDGLTVEIRVPLAPRETRTTRDAAPDAASRPAGERPQTRPEQRPDPRPAR